MSAATDFLRTWITKAGTRSPSITRMTMQRWPQVGTPPHFKPGIASYGWGINGSLIKDGGGQPIGLRFSTTVWFSDRGLSLAQAPPDSGQQFLGTKSDREVLELTLAGDVVHVRCRLLTWSTEWSADTTRVDAASQMLLVGNIPPAGPDPVRALMVIALADTGSFGWL